MHHIAKDSIANFTAQPVDELYIIDQAEKDMIDAHQSLIFRPKFIPYDVQLEERLGLTKIETLLFGFIDFFLSGSPDKKFYFSNKQLGEILNCGEDSISKAMKKLQDLDLIMLTQIVRSGGGKVRFVRLVKNTASDTQFSTSLTRKKHGVYIKENKINKNKIKESGEKLSHTSSSSSQESLKAEPVAEQWKRIVQELKADTLPAIAEPYAQHYSKQVILDELQKFMSYWFEPTKSGRKYRWETEKTFYVGRRFGLWMRNYPRFNNDAGSPTHWGA